MQARLDRLAEFGYATPPHILQAAWTARLWPARVEAARLGAVAFLSNLNDRLIAALRDEKAAFARELAGYPGVVTDFAGVGTPQLLELAASSSSGAKASAAAAAAGGGAGSPGGAKGGRASAAAGGPVPAIAIPATPSSPKGRGESEDAGEEGGEAAAGGASPVARMHPLAAKQLVERTYDAVTQLSDKLENAAARVADFNAREAVLGLPESTYEGLTAVVADFEPFRELWTIVNDFEVRPCSELRCHILLPVVVSFPPSSLCRRAASAG